MAVNYLVQLTIGDSTANYDIYYDVISSSNYAILISTSLNATGITYNDLFNGVSVTIPDSSTTIIIRSNGVCKNYTLIPIKPTTTPPAPSNLCMSFERELTNNLWLFTPYGTLNGRPFWTYSTYSIIWNPAIPANAGGPNGRWEMALNSGLLFTTTNTTDTPDSGWYPIGNGASGIHSLQVTQGSCPAVTNLSAEVTPSNTTCYNTTPCDGTAVVVPSGGVPPYTYSIDGVNFQTSNVIQNLCEGRYSVITKDSTNATATSRFFIGYDNVPVVYTITTQVTNSNTIVSTPQQKTTQSYWELVFDNPIPVGTTVNLSIIVNTGQKLNGPGNGTITSNTQVYKNSILQTLVSSTSSSSTSQRPLCSSETVYTTANTETYNVSLTNGDVLSGYTLSNMIITNLVTSSVSRCSTKLEQSIGIQPVLNAQDSITGCRCCNVVVGTINQNLISDTLG